MVTPFEPDMQPASNDQSDNRSHKYTEANDRSTEMTDMDICMKRLEEKGYKTQYRVEKGKLVSMETQK